MQSSCPVRELAPGERPRDWLASENDAGSLGASEEPTTTETTAPASPAGVDSTELDPVSAGPLAPERYKVQFTATEEYVRLIEEAKALLSHAAPRTTLDEIHLRALRAFVAQLRKQKFATAESPSRQTQPAAPGELSASQSKASAPELDVEPSKARTTSHLRCAAHNALAAEHDFGRELIQVAKASRP